tara:strand:+ start:860 stop:1006 length:147 start_codon:yes stop_codon:yes gene_type:complete
MSQKSNFKVFQRHENRKKYPEIAKVFDELKKLGFNPKVIKIYEEKNVD